MGAVSYRGRVLEKFNVIIENKEYCMSGRLYKNNALNVYYSVNNRGYLHVYTPSCIRRDGSSIIRYGIKDVYLTKDGVLKERAVRGKFESTDDIVKYLDKIVERGGSLE